MRGRCRAWTSIRSGTPTATATNVSNAIGAVSGSSSALESLEPSFHQDLNGDGVVGVPVANSTTIESAGATSLVEVSSNFFLNPIAGGAGPELKYGGAVVVAGQFGGWTPIGAEVTASGYEIAWKMSGVDEYTVWNTDGNGNYVGNAIGAVSGSSAALESVEPSFHQDLNGDGVIGVPSATSPLTTSMATALFGQTTFDGTTLTLQQPSTFSGQLVGFTGNGSPGSDQIDLRGFNFNSLHSSFDSASGTLSATDGSSTTTLQFLGQYSQHSFHFADDGNGGSLVIAAALPVQNSVPQVSDFAARGTFVFAPNFGQVTLANFTPATDTVQFSKSVFADVATLLAAIHDDASGNAVINDAAQDTISVLHVTTAQLLAHLTDFHFV